MKGHPRQKDHGEHERPAEDEDVVEEVDGELADERLERTDDDKEADGQHAREERREQKAAQDDRKERRLVLRGIEQVEAAEEGDAEGRSIQEHPERRVGTELELGDDDGKGDNDAHRGLVYRAVEWLAVAFPPELDEDRGGKARKEAVGDGAHDALGPKPQHVVW